jgi:hypothetical protein
MTTRSSPEALPKTLRTTPLLLLFPFSSIVLGNTDGIGQHSRNLSIVVVFEFWNPIIGWVFLRNGVVVVARK